MSDTYNDMYGDNGDNTTPATHETTSINLQEKGMMTEIEINGKKISVVDISIVMKLNSDLRTMNAIIAKLTNDIRNLTIRISNAERRFTAINAELDNKVGYE